METATPDNQIQIIERSTVVFKNAGEILRNNKSRSEKAVEVGRKILAAIQADGMTPDLDQRAMNYLANVGKAGKEMKESRAEVTQIMDEIKKMYTALENDIDCKKVGTVPSLIQTERDAYARKCAEEERRKREEEEKKAHKAREAVDIKTNITIALNTYFQNHLLNVKQRTTGSFNNTTLETIGEFEEKLRRYQPEYKEDHYNLFQFHTSFIYHTPDEFVALISSVKTDDLYKQFDTLYKTEMGNLAQDLLDKIPSKKSELLEQKRIADEQAAEAERQRIAEEERQAAIAKANKAQREKLEKEAAIARQKEAERLEQLRKEQEAAAEEKRLREEAEALRMKQESEEAQKQAELEAEMKKQGDQTMIMFDQEAAMSEGAQAPEARQGYDLIVSHQAGFVQIFQFWFEKEGKSLGLDKMEKTSLGQMKAFCEKYAHKNNEKIDSKFLKYEPSFKAVNRKPAK
jgi:hypothetical protein